ncbi:hypothetical protein ABK040_013797 [Willaertia magna]
MSQTSQLTPISKSKSKSFTTSLRNLLFGGCRGTTTDDFQLTVLTDDQTESETSITPRERGERVFKQREIRKSTSLKSCQSENNLSLNITETLINNNGNKRASNLFIQSSTNLIQSTYANQSPSKVLIQNSVGFPSSSNVNDRMALDDELYINTNNNSGHSATFTNFTNTTTGNSSNVSSPNFKIRTGEDPFRAQFKLQFQGTIGISKCNHLNIPEENLPAFKETLDSFIQVDWTIQHEPLNTLHQMIKLLSGSKQSKKTNIKTTDTKITDLIFDETLNFSFNVTGVINQYFIERIQNNSLISVITITLFDFDDLLNQDNKIASQKITMEIPLPKLFQKHLNNSATTPHSITSPRLQRTLQNDTKNNLTQLTEDILLVNQIKEEFNCELTQDNDCSISLNDNLPNIGLYYAIKVVGQPIIFIDQ